MTTKEKQIQLARYRLKQADDCIDEALYLFHGKKSARSIINRVYYAMFYSVLALLIFEPYSSSKHSGVLAYFNKKFVKEGIFSEVEGRSINKAFELRQRADYRENIEIAYEQVEPFLEKARIFVQKVTEHLEKNVFNSTP